ncbi:hypothetical protein PFISCL1PPCAC_15949 [Pristionchus fissidentatus]|uniref:Glucosylceramidase n=1 Tax=Pristionchus fissidentatus TaxID=1538716 RepID=A0AAV5VYH1_9BILA|nr:hypothetical protein PFISCL1PPCAC_15949 [Pristionchus fissidentatus]
MEANFLVNQLGPALKNNSLTKDLKIFSMTDQRGALPNWINTMFSSPSARNFSDGISVHWYEDDFKSADLLTQTHEKYPEQIIIASEASNGFMDSHQIRMRPGDYGRAEKYVHSVIEDLNNFVGGWIDWNLALDMAGGPTWVDNVLDSTILVDSRADEFLKQPSYYALAHFSKFLKPGSRRVKMEAISGLAKNVEMLGAVGVDGNKVVVVMNKDKKETVHVSIADKTRLDVINLDLSPRSFVTIVWK